MPLTATERTAVMEAIDSFRDAVTATVETELTADGAAGNTDNP